MKNSQDQANAEKIAWENTKRIAEWLDEEDRIDNILDNYPHQFCKNWLTSDAGTVAIILKMRNYSCEAKWMMFDALMDDDINTALQSAILELIKEE